MTTARTDQAPRVGWSVPIQEVVSPGGIRAWLLSDPSVPVIALSFAMVGGAALDPAGQEGRAMLAAALLDEGAGPHDTAAFSTLLRDRAVSLNVSTDRDSLSGSLRMLSSEAGFAADMLALALTQPRFDTDAIERNRAQRLITIRREGEDPRSLAARRWWAEALPGHPFSRPSGGTEVSIAALTRDDLLAGLAAQLRRGSLIAACAGAIDAAGLGALLDQAFGGLAAGQVAAIPAVPVARAFGVAVIERDVPQAAAIFGHPTIAPDDPDWEPAQLVNWVFGGGGFASRLMTEVREKRGLTYGIGTGLSPLGASSAMLLGSVSTDNPRFAETLAVTRAEWARMAENGPTDVELEDAKSFLTGSFPLGFTATGQIAGTLVGLQQLGRTPAWLAGRLARVAAVTAEDAKRAARRMLDPIALSVAVAGRGLGVG